MRNANQTKVRLEFTARAAAIARTAAVASARTVDEWVRDSVRGSLMSYARRGKQPAAPGAGPDIRRVTLDKPLPLRVVDRYVRAPLPLRVVDRYVRARGRATMRPKPPDEH
jgi:hypothetical protein